MKRLYKRLILPVMVFAIGTATTGSPNPITWYKMMQETDARKKEAFNEYRDLQSKLYGENGLTDLNEDCIIDKQKRLDSWLKMGLEDQIRLLNQNIEVY